MNQEMEDMVLLLHGVKASLKMSEWGTEGVNNWIVPERSLANLCRIGWKGSGSEDGKLIRSYLQ